MTDYPLSFAEYDHLAAWREYLRMNPEKAEKYRQKRLVHDSDSYRRYIIKRAKEHVPGCKVEPRLLKAVLEQM